MKAAVETVDLFRIHAAEAGAAAALQGLSFRAREGEIVVVLGPSGAGKTTLLRILAGLDRPSAGSVHVFDLEVSRLAGRRLAEYRTKAVGYADQHYGRALAPELTARELVALRLGLTGAPVSERRRRADELLDRVGLLDRGGANPHELSGGEQQRIAICAALAHRPRLLLADEPTGELDAANAAVVYDLIGEIAREEGCTTIIVSHDMQSTAIADRVIEIRDGRVSAESARNGGGREAIVVGRGGWLRLPEHFLRRSGVDALATARLVREGILVSSAERSMSHEREGASAPTPRRKATGATAAELIRVEKKFGCGGGARVVFAGLDARFEEGRLTVVTGPSGSGKTTLLHLLAGLTLPDSGDVRVGNVSIASLERRTRAELRRTRLAFLGQDADLLPFLSACENIAIALELRGVTAAEADSLARSALVDIGLGELIEHRVSRLSVGERQRVAIARALAGRPTLLLADEPSARLDEASALALGTLFGKVAGEGTTIVCATHDRAVIEQADAELNLA
jgi:ABC-type lipoprotein export system ATPase subunit